MKRKISSYRLAYNLIDRLCHMKSIGIVDLNIEYTDGSDRVENGTMFIRELDKFDSLILSIVYNYITFDYKIHEGSLFDSNTEKQEFLTSLSICLPHLITTPGNEGKGVPACVVDGSVVYVNLSTFTLIWSILDNIVLPMNNIESHNLKCVLIDSKHDIDGAYFYNNNIFVNMGITNTIVRSAYILCESISAHELCPRDSITQLLRSDFYDKFIGVLKSLLLDDRLVDFYVRVLKLICGIHGVAAAKSIKTAQVAGPLSTTWWYLGLLEAMLEPARGSDWTTHQKLEPYVKKIREEIAEYKKEHKISDRDGVPFEVMLRITSDDSRKCETDETIQALLRDVRDWN